MVKFRKYGWKSEQTSEKLSEKSEIFAKFGNLGKLKKNLCINSKTVQSSETLLETLKIQMKFEKKNKKNHG